MEERDRDARPKFGHLLRGRVRPRDDSDETPKPDKPAPTVARATQGFRNPAPKPPEVLKPIPKTEEQPEELPSSRLTLIGSLMRDPSTSDSKPAETKPAKDTTEEDYKRVRTKLARELAEEQLRKAAARKARAESLAKHRKTLATALLAAARKTAGLTNRSLRALAQKAAAHKRATAVTTAALLILIGAATVWPVPQIRADRAAKTASKVAAAAQKDPEFQTVAPQGDVGSTSGGKIAYDEDKKVASYTDKIGDVGITLSQQPLPPPFAANPADELAKFAESIYAKEKIEVGDVTAYVGASIKGNQTVVFVKNHLLIFMTTDSKISNDAIKEYISTLL